MKSTKLAPSRAPESSPAELCPHCAGKVNPLKRECPKCGKDVGFPNVRLAGVPAEVAALEARFAEACAECDRAGTRSELDSLEECAQKDSQIVIAMRGLQARSFLSDPNQLYQGYEGMVGSNARLPAPPENDAERCEVAGKLFGITAKEIRYGALSLDGRGLANYGSVFLSLDQVAVSHRTSFIDENPFTLLPKLRTTPGRPIEKGRRSTWGNRGQLVCCKLSAKLKAGDTRSEFEKLLLFVGKTRQEDDFVEAHIYGTFNPSAVSHVNFASAPTKDLSAHDKRTIEKLAKKP